MFLFHFCILFLISLVMQASTQVKALTYFGSQMNMMKGHL